MGKIRWGCLGIWLGIVAFSLLFWYGVYKILVDIFT